MTGPGSTQTHALGLLRGASLRNSSAIPPGFEGGFVVYSWEQKEGHGQHQRPWQHSGEALALTVAWPLQKLVCLGLPSGHSPPWPLWLSVVIRDALSKWLGQRLSEPLELKWPNDLLLGGGKVADYLAEDRVYKESIARLETSLQPWGRVQLLEFAHGSSMSSTEVALAAARSTTDISLSASVRV